MQLAVAPHPQLNAQTNTILLNKEGIADCGATTARPINVVAVVKQTITYHFTQRRMQTVTNACY